MAFEESGFEHSHHQVWLLTLDMMSIPRLLGILKDLQRYLGHITTQM
jgi:hypothetical protein